MSWDVLIVKSDGQTPVHELPKEHQFASLGDAEELRNELSKFFGPIDWTDSAWGTWSGNGFSYEFNFQTSGPIESFALHVRGCGDAVAPIIEMCKRFDWHAVDFSSGEFIDLENPSTNWEAYQSYRDRLFHDASSDKVLVLNAEDQAAFFAALKKPAKLTDSQQKLGEIMRGEA